MSASFQFFLYAALALAASICIAWSIARGRFGFGARVIDRRERPAQYWLFAFDAAALAVLLAVVALHVRQYGERPEWSSLALLAVGVAQWLTVVGFSRAPHARHRQYDESRRSS
jgi:DMSO/TMAO reductase YedYZ heme-binding membrane subunit